MKRLLKIFLWTFLITFCLLILWVVGLLAQLPLIPWIETDYFVVGTNQTLANGLTLKQTDNTNIKIEVPNYFSEDDQCFDFWFSSANGKHLLTVDDFSLIVYDNDNSELKRENTYLFWDNGSKNETFKIENYEIAKTDTCNKNKYVFFRTVFDIDKIGNFKIKVKVNYSIDNKSDSINQTLTIEKKHRLTWNKFRVH